MENIKQDPGTSVATKRPLEDEHPSDLAESREGSKRPRSEHEVVSADMDGDSGWQHRHKIVDGTNVLQVHLFNRFTEPRHIDVALQNLRDGDFNTGAHEYCFAWRVADPDARPSMAAALSHVPLIHQGCKGDDDVGAAQLLRMLFNVGSNNVILAVSRKPGKPRLPARRKEKYVAILANEALLESGNGKLSVLETIADELERAHPVQPAILVNPDAQLVSTELPAPVTPPRATPQAAPTPAHGPDPAPEPVLATPPTSQNSGLDEAGPLCACNKPSSTIVSQSKQNPGREYWQCTARKLQGRPSGCDFFEWKDEHPGDKPDPSPLKTPTKPAAAAEVTYPSPDQTPGRIPLCKGCSRPCRIAIVKKQGANTGRKFWQCPSYRPNGPQCPFNGFADGA